MSVIQPKEEVCKCEDSQFLVIEKHGAYDYHRCLTCKNVIKVVDTMKEKRGGRTRKKSKRVPPKIHEQ